MEKQEEKQIGFCILKCDTGNDIFQDATRETCENMARESKCGSFWYRGEESEQGQFYG